MSQLISLRACIVAVSLLTCGWAQAIDYMSVSAAHAILYDAPSLQAKRLFVVNRYMPFEVVVSLDTWVKVRDRSGALYWVEKGVMSFKRYVYAVSPVVDIRSEPDFSSPSVLQVRQQVALEVLENTNTGWLKVRHQDGLLGFVKHSDVWGD